MSLLAKERAFVLASEPFWKEESGILVYKVDDDFFFPTSEQRTKYFFYFYVEGNKYGKGWYKYGVELFPLDDHVKNLEKLRDAYSAFAHIVGEIRSKKLLAWRLKRKYSFDPDGGDLGGSDE